MKNGLFIWGIAFVLVIIAVLVTKVHNSVPNANNLKQQAEVQEAQLPGEGDNDALGEKALDFTLEDLDGKKVSLKDFKGKNVYLNFFATWCPPCKSEMPDIEKVYQKYKDRDLVVLAVNLGEDKGTVTSFIEKNKYSFRVLLDSDQSVGQRYNISAIPVSYFIDKDGTVVAKRVGALSVDEMESYVKMLNT